MTVLPGHVPVLTSLQAGLIVATDIQGKEQHLLVLGGFAEITADRVIVLAERALHPDELTRERLEGEIRHLEAVPRRHPRAMYSGSALPGHRGPEPIENSIPIESRSSSRDAIARAPGVPRRFHRARAPCAPGDTGRPWPMPVTGLRLVRRRVAPYTPAPLTTIVNIKLKGTVTFYLSGRRLGHRLVIGPACAAVESVALGV